MPTMKTACALLMAAGVRDGGGAAWSQAPRNLKIVVPLAAGAAPISSRASPASRSPACRARPW